MDAKLKQRVAELDAELVRLAKPVIVLKHLSWPDTAQDEFLAGWRAGRPVLPSVQLNIPDWTEIVTALDKFISRCQGDDPLLDFLRNTAWSYGEAARMLMAAGKPEFTEHSIRLYGRPDEAYETQKLTGLDAANFLMEKTDQLLSGKYVAPTNPDVPAEAFAERLRRVINEYFADDPVEVIVDTKLSAKAIAGKKGIRIRASALFSDLDFDQLYHHEALIHTATAINGLRQVNLQSLSLGAPRTTRSQEGIAVFAELATQSIDINRLRRLALRVQALKAAMDGADFIECFQLFLEGGQDEREAYNSTQRLFRGGDVRGRIVFTKDCTYLKGLIETHVFMNISIRDNHPQFIERMFAGRLTLADAVRFEPYFESGFLQRPRYVPPWARDTRRLAASLAYSSFIMKVNLDAISIDRFVRVSAERQDMAP